MSNDQSYKGEPRYKDLKRGDKIIILYFDLDPWACLGKASTIDKIQDNVIMVGGYEFDQRTGFQHNNSHSDIEICPYTEKRENELRDNAKRITLYNALYNTQFKFREHTLEQFEKVAEALNIVVEDNPYPLLNDLLEASNLLKKNLESEKEGN